MSVPDPVNTEPIFDHYELSLEIFVPPNYRDQVVLESDDLAAFVPEFRVEEGAAFAPHVWERYVDDNPVSPDYVEVRQDHVVSRRLTSIYVRPTLPEMTESDVHRRDHT